jgi:hypothetical protein
LDIFRFTDESAGSSLPFKSTITKFLATCKDQKKTKLIIDVRGNPGGVVSTAYDAFKQIFPKQQLYARHRLRAHPAMDAYGTVISTLTPLTLDQYTQLVAQGDQVPSDVVAEAQADASVFNAANNLKTTDGDAYANWKAFYGPQTFNGDQFANYFAPDFKSMVYDLETGGMVISGYGNETNVAAQVFDSKNVTLVSSSPCHIPFTY